MWFLIPELGRCDLSTMLNESRILLDLCPEGFIGRSHLAGNIAGHLGGEAIADSYFFITLALQGSSTTHLAWEGRGLLGELLASSPYLSIRSRPPEGLIGTSEGVLGQGSSRWR